MKQEHVLSIDDLVRRVEPARIGEDLWRLVCVPSPTRRERAAALLYAEMLRGCGAEVEIDESIHESPSIIGRVRGGRPGPTLQLAGHIDTIDVAHAAPVRDGDLISGRGAADMKAGCASILEIVRILASERQSFAGSLLVTVYGLHEAPLGHSEGLSGLIEKRIVGDAAIVMEGPPDMATVRGKGQSIWTLTLRREGDVCHELRRQPKDDLLLDAALAIAAALREENQALSRSADLLLGPETIFVGQLHYGDFYNRSPRTCMLQGTRRWHPDKRFEDVKDHFARLLSGAGLPKGIEAEVEWTFVGESFSVDPGERIVTALRDAARTMRGRELPLGGVSAVMDTSRLVPEGRVPTVPIDFDGGTAHADAEHVRISLVADGCRLALRTALNYLAAPAAPGQQRAGRP